MKCQIKAHGGGRVVSASGSETSVTSSTPTSAIIYDAYTSIIKNKNFFFTFSGRSLQILQSVYQADCCVEDLLRFIKTKVLSDAYLFVKLCV